MSTDRQIIYSFGFEKILYGENPKQNPRNG